MAKDIKILKELLNSKDIIYPHQLFYGLNMSENDFISIGELLEKSREETTKKFITIRNIGNSIIQKNGIVQGIYYRETDIPELVLIFRSQNPLNWERRKMDADEKVKKAQKEKKDTEKKANENALEKAQEEAKDNENAPVNPTLSDKDLDKIDEKVKKVAAASEAVAQLEKEQKEYQEKYKDILAEIASYDINEKIKIRNGEAVFDTDDYDSRLPAITINEQILDYLLNSTNLGSDLDIALVGTYVDELKQFKAALESGILYPDFYAKDYTGTLGIQSKHRGLTILKPNNSMTIPSDFGKIKVYLNSDSFWHSFKLVYTADDNDYDLTADFNHSGRIINRGFIHKALLPEPYRNNK